MTRTLIEHVDVVTLDAAGTVLRDVALAIDDNLLLAVGAAPIGFQADQVIDGYNQVALPGFVNAHCHSPMTYERGWAEDLSFPRWLNEKIWVAESALTPDDVYWGAALAACEMIRSGVVAFNDHYFYMDRVAEVVEQAGLKAGLTWCVFGIGDDKEVGANLDGTLAFIDRWQGRADGRIKLLLGPHSPYICPPDFLARIARLAHERGLTIHLHVSESQEQVDNSLRAYGKTSYGKTDNRTEPRVFPFKVVQLPAALSDAGVYGARGVTKTDDFGRLEIASGWQVPWLGNCLDQASALFGQACYEMKKMVNALCRQAECSAGGEDAVCEDAVSADAVSWLPGAGDLYVTVFGGRTGSGARMRASDTAETTNDTASTRIAASRPTRKAVRS